MELMWERLTRAFEHFGWQNGLQLVFAILLCYVLLAFLRRNKLTGLIKYLGFLFVAFGFVLACFTSLSSDSAVNSVIVAVTYGVATILIFIIFRNETRREVFKLASPRKESAHFTAHHGISDEELQACVTEVVRGCISLAKNNMGALIILAHANVAQHVLDSGTRIDAIVSSSLLECLFNTKAPLHDGAAIVEGNRVIAAGCFLPLSQSTTLPKEFGTRHRAGIGITETADVLSIIVSEETGIISVVKNGALTRYYDANMLTQAIEQFYGLKAVEATTHRRRRR